MDTDYSMFAIVRAVNYGVPTCFLTQHWSSD